MLKKKLELRLYQEELLDKASKANSLIVLPTGLGKTFIALGLSVLKDSGKTVFMAPTRPLVEQHKKLYDEFTDFRSVIATGLTPPSERKGMYENAQIIFCTPQTIENDILTGKFDLKQVSLIIFDEAHRAVGDYAYVFIAQQYKRLNPNGRILAMTASPGSDREQIESVCKNLGVKMIYSKNYDSPSVKPYINEKKVIPVVVELPEGMSEIKKELETVKKEILKELKSNGLIKSEKYCSKKDILVLQKNLWAAEVKDSSVYSNIRDASAAFKILHALELVETKGVEPLRQYFSKMEKEKNRVRSSGVLFLNPNFRNAYFKALKTEEEHPKITELERIIKSQDLKKSKIIVFSNLRDVSKMIAKKLNKIKEVKASEFLGQKEGFTQKKQLETLERFKKGELNVLVATQVIHEGIHVSEADVGIFFEPLASAIQTIQRKGRIGRTGIGKIYVMMTKGCVDEKHYWASRWNEKKAGKTIDELSKPQKTLRNY